MTCPICYASSTPEPVPVNVNVYTGDMILGDRTVLWKDFELALADSVGSAGLVFYLESGGTSYQLVHLEGLQVFVDNVPQALSTFTVDAAGAYITLSAPISSDQSVRIHALVREA